MINKKQLTLVLSMFTVMHFVLAMTAGVFNGILDQIALSMDVSIAESGMLNTMYAYGGAIGVPITIILFRNIERTRLLKSMLIVTIMMSIALVYLPNFGLLLFARLIMGISANSYGVLAIGEVVALAPKEKQGRAMAFLIMGSSFALVAGIPLTRFLADIFDWRGIFWLLSGIMFLALLCFHLFLPQNTKEPSKLQLKNELLLLKEKQTFTVISCMFIMFIGYGAFYTYLTPYLLLLFPSIEQQMVYILVFLGISSFIGNLLGGFVADRIGYAKALLLGSLIQIVLTILIFFTQGYFLINIALALLWLMNAWFIGLQLNTGITQATQNKSNVMISLNSSANQFGGAVGASLAAIVIANSGIQNIILITIVASIVITLIQLVGRK